MASPATASRSVLCATLGPFLTKRQEIHAKITSIGFEDCKVFIHSVDAQSSANGGIIIQVIGEMSNRNDPWRKFVQTFFLAEQPNGYFVLNDIFRFLKEESVESDENEEPVPEQPVQEAPAPPAPAPVAAEPEPPARELTPSPPPTPPPAPVVAEPTPEPEPAPPTPVVEEAPVTVADVPEPPLQVPTPEPEPPAAKTNGVHAAPEPTPPPPAPVEQAPPKPPQPKTWANLAATNSKKWGANVAQESKGHTEVVPPAPASAPASGTQTPAQQPPPVQPNTRGPHPNFVAANSVTTPHCFVKVFLSSFFALYFY